MSDGHLNTCDYFSGEELEIADRIQHLRYLMLIHSRIHYVLNNDLIPERDFYALAKELARTQNEYPEIADRVDFSEAFRGWDGSTGASLPLNDPWVIQRTNLVYMSKSLVNSRLQKKEAEAAEKDDYPMPYECCLEVG